MNRTRQEPRLPPGAQTLVKYLVNAGLGSRRDSAELITAGRVRVNGIPATSLNHPVRAKDRVDVDGAPVRAAPPRQVYLLLNKPEGYLSTVTDDRGRRTVMDLVPEEYRVPGLVPAGRLDLNSTGLMLLTNDGDLVEMVTHPRYGVEKEYRIRIDRPLTPDQIRTLVSGVQLEDGPARAKTVRRLSEENGQYLYTVTLVEGRKREVRRMLMAVGRRVEELQRTRMGNISLGQLPEGRTRELTDAELRGLLAIIERRPGDSQRATPTSPAGRASTRKGPENSASEGRHPAARPRRHDKPAPPSRRESGRPKGAGDASGARRPASAGPRRGAERNGRPGPSSAAGPRPRPGRGRSGASAGRSPARHPTPPSRGRPRR